MTTFIGVFACLLAAVEVDLSGDRGIAADIAYLAEVSRTNVLAARFPMDNGSMACPPQAKRGYRQFFLRDYAYVLEGCADVLPEKDLLDAARLFLMAISSEGAGCDFVDRSGWYNYRPGGGTIGENPVVDGTPFTVAVEYLTWRQTRAAELLDSAVLDKLAWAMEKGVPRNPETGLVHIAPRAGAVTLATKLDRAPYGFTDVVRKQGDVLFGSLLYCEAAIRLAEMFNAAGHPAEAEKWRRTAQTVKDGINKTLWDEKTGLYLAASHTCRQADVWGSAFAIWIGVADAMRADRISRTLVGHYDGIVQNGQVRHLLPGDYWQLADAPRDTYQNGGFWGTASGWVANAIARTDLPLARRMLADLVRFYREKGVPEWSIDGVGKGHLELEGYLASTTVPLAVFRRLFAGAVLSASSSHAAAYDIVIYGSTPAAISAAVQAKRSGKSVVVVSPETRIGGMTTGGLGQTDGANLSCYGGIAREFYRAIKAHYDKPESWTRQTKKSYSGFAWAGKDGASADTMWTFEPSAALAILEGWEKRDGLEIHRGKRLDRSAGKVKVEGEGERRRIVSFFTEDGTEYGGKMFIDATYEGDLMAAAGVSYTVGREGNEVYGETVNGIQRTMCGKGHRFVAKVDPYVEKGNPSSGLLKYVERDVPEPDGTGDRRVQAYCFRLCLTTDPENRVPFEKPEGYDERDYELAFRDFEGRKTGMVWLNPPMPNLKSDCNSGGAVSLDFIGGSDRWPEASYAERERIFAAHVRWQKGIIWTCANHPRIPEELRREVSRWGLAKDEFVESGNWPTQLYVREGRRMVGEYVITENDCTRRRITPKPVLRASFNMDAHNVRRTVGADGFVFNEGDVQVPPLPPFHLVPYGALTPKRGECANLLVPVCLSASHIAYGSIRMEPMFFGLGQVAALGAVRAIDDGVAVQDVSYAALRRNLDAAGVPSGDSVPTFIRRLERKIPQKVVCYGTSLTEGGSWVKKMRAMLEVRYPGIVEVVNSGRGGQNSNYGVSYLKTQVLELKPDAVFIEFAMNDAVTRFKVSVGKARANLENMIGRIRAELPGAEIILQTMNPYAGEDATKRPRLDDYYDMYREVAAREGLLLVDHNRAWKDLLHEEPVRYRMLVPDGTHPNARGTDEVIMPTFLRILTVRE